MFQEQPEKGLFTFYWEQTHKEKKEQHHSHRSQHIQPSQLKEQKYTASMEEKKVRAIHHKTEKNQPVIKRHQSYLYIQIEKQNKSALVPHMITLSPRIDESDFKVDQEGYKLKHFKEFLKAKTNEYEKKHKNANHNPLLFLDQGNQCHKKNLTLDENIIPASNSCLNTGRAVKIRKATIKEAHINLKTSNKQKIPSINLNQDQSQHSNMFPKLFASKISHKKLKKINENDLIQRICSQKNSQGRNSIVNIGISSVDDYNSRWRKRKAQFMALLSQSTEERQSK